jgi:hypothetical protein
MWLGCAGWFFPPYCLLKEACGVLGFKAGVRSLISVRWNLVCEWFFHVCLAVENANTTYPYSIFMFAGWDGWLLGGLAFLHGLWRFCSLRG